MLLERRLFLRVGLFLGLLSGSAWAAGRGMNRPSPSGGSAVPVGVPALSPQAGIMPVAGVQGPAQLDAQGLTWPALATPNLPPAEVPAASDAQPGQPSGKKDGESDHRPQAPSSPPNVRSAAKELPALEQNAKPETTQDPLGAVFDGSEERPVKAFPVLFSKVYFPKNVVSWTVPPDEVSAVLRGIHFSGQYFVAATFGKKGEDGQEPNLHPIASLAKVLQIQEGSKVIISFEVVSEAKIIGLEKDGQGRATTARLEYPELPRRKPNRENRLMRVVKLGFTELMQLSGKLESDPVQLALRQTDPERAANQIAYGMEPLEFQQKLLSTLSISRRLRLLFEHILARTTEARLDLKVKATLELARKRTLLETLMRQVRSELGEDGESESDKLRDKINASGMNEEAKALALEELEQLQGRGPNEGAWIRQHIHYLLKMPWTARTEDHVDIKEAKRILDRSHAVLPKVKERIIEELAVYKRTGRLQGKILCFVGPPGVGKTSIARAIAEAMGRKFTDLRLGGVSDASQIIGLHRNYANAFPGMITDHLQRIGVKNPVSLLDEIDKLGKDGLRGDPAAALLSVLDPDQNSVFRETYMDVPFDLSEVFFIATANDESQIPAALKDRLEIIRFDSYTPNEKLHIALKHLAPKLRGEMRLSAKQVSFDRAAIRHIIRSYTMEGGVRGLRRQIEAVMRKVVARMEMGRAAPGRIKGDDVKRYLGAPRYIPDTSGSDIGVATGLGVFGDLGGVTMNIEAFVTPGKGRISLRREMGQEISDAADNAIEYVKLHGDKFGFPADYFREMDIAINVSPSGKVDGPSAGIALVTALVSRLTQRKVRKGIAMTGEVDPGTGKVLAIGGLKEKVIAAHRVGYHTVLYPEDNRKDLESIPREIRAAIKLVPVQTMDQALKRALEPKRS